VLVTDEFMEAVRDGSEFMLRSPRDGSERGKVDARSLFQKLVETRLATGEPYIIFIDQVNRSMPKHHRDLGLKVSTSNLCSEITLPTGKDHLGADRTAVLEIAKNAQTVFDELMRLAALDVRDESNAARILVERGIVETLRERCAGTSGRAASGKCSVALLLAHLILPRRRDPLRRTHLVRAPARTRSTRN